MDVLESGETREDWWWHIYDTHVREDGGEHEMAFMVWEFTLFLHDCTTNGGLWEIIDTIKRVEL